MAEQQFGEVATMPIATMAALLTAVDTALQAEGIDETVITRVRNRLVWGHPDGSDAVVRLTPDEYSQIRTDFLRGSDDVRVD